MTMPLRWIAVFLLSTSLLRCTPAPAQTPVKDGDRIVFLGDSITGDLHYTRQVEAYFTLRYPALRLHFYNVGYGGDTATRRLPRLAREVLSLKPTVVTICYGMNDGWGVMASAARADDYKKAMRAMVQEIKKAGARVVLLTPGCVDTDHDQHKWLKKTDWTYNDVLRQLADQALEIAAAENVPVYNLHRTMVDVQTCIKKDDPLFTMIPDGIHPTAAGHAVMTYCLLKAWGCTEPASGLEIDAATAQTTPDRCRITDLKVQERAITFTRTDAALPTGFYPDIKPIPNYLPLVDEFNRYRFKVVGLKAPLWKLTVAGKEVGVFSSTALAAGINLAPHPGPWEAQAKQVNDIIVHEQAEFLQRWAFLSQFPTPDELMSDLNALIAQADAYVDTIQNERMRAAQPPTLKWSLVATNAVAPK